MSLHLLDKALAYAPKKRVMSVTFAIQYSLINLEKIFTRNQKLSDNSFSNNNKNVCFVKKFSITLFTNVLYSFT